jgi:hypothetical protein
LKHIKSYKLFEGEEETYSFEELSPEAQGNVIENNREINVDYDGWEDGVTEDFQEDMKNIGIDDITISYTGFNSQGDGASFTSDDVDTRKLFDAVGIKSNKALNMEVDDERSSGENKEFYDLLDTMEDVGQVDRNRIKPEELRVWIERIDSRHYHENTIRAHVEIWEEPDGWEESYGFLDELGDKVTEYVRELCKDLYRKLEGEYDNLTSDESVKSTLIDNDYKFDEEGNLV